VRHCGKVGEVGVRSGFKVVRFGDSLAIVVADVTCAAAAGGVDGMVRHCGDEVVV